MDEQFGKRSNIDRYGIDRLERWAAVVGEQRILPNPFRKARSEIRTEHAEGDMMNVARRGFGMVDPQSEAVAEPGCMERPWGEGRADHLSTLTVSAALASGHFGKSQRHAARRSRRRTVAQTQIALEVMIDQTSADATRRAR